MTALDLVPLVINSSICFAASLMLLTVKSYSEMGSKSFKRIKQLLACCGMLEVAHILLILWCENFHIDAMVINGFYHPSMYYVQLCVVTVGLLGLVHSSKFTLRNTLISLSPVILLVPIHTVAYLIYSGGVFSLNTSFAVITINTLWLCILAECIIGIYLLITETHTYRHQLVNVFSGNEVINGRKLSFLVYGFLAYFALLLIEIFVNNDFFYLFYTFFDTAIFLAGTIVLFNIQDMYSRVMLVEDYMKKDSDEGDASHYVDEQFANQKINELITEWESRPDKPYVKNGLTLVDVAQDVKIQPNQLSNYFQTICKMDFNSWVDIHRIDEAMKLLTSDADMDLHRVAMASGFRNVKSMTKAFRTLTGKAPSAYKMVVESNTKDSNAE